VSTHLCGFADAVGGPDDGIFKQAPYLGGSCVLDGIGNGRNFIGDIAEVLVDHADLFDEIGGCGDGWRDAAGGSGSSASCVLFLGSSGRGGVVL